MNKIKLTIFTFLLLLSSVFLLPVKANSSKWIKESDGYHYYDFSYVKLNTDIAISVENKEILEVRSEYEYDMIYTNTITVDGKRVEFNKVIIRIELNSGFYDVSIAHYDNSTLLKKYNYQSYVNLQSFYEDKIVRKLSNITDIPDDEYTTVDKLPLTEENPNIYNMFGGVKFYKDGNRVVVIITYYVDYKIRFNLDANTDFSIFTEAIEAYYLNVNGKPQIIINNTDKPILKDLLLSEVNYDVPEFLVHTIWDLKTNTLETVDKYDAYVYLKQNNTGAVVAYFYTDDIVIDNIMKVRLKFSTRDRYKFPFNLSKGDYSDWETEEVEYEANDFFRYKNKTSDWQDWIPVWNRIRWITKLAKTYEMPGVEKVNFDNQQSYYNVTINELNSYYAKKNSDFNRIKDNSRYNVHAFALYENKDNMVQEKQFYNTENPDDPNNFQIIEMLFKTNGELHVLHASDWDIKLSPGGPGVVIPDDPNAKPAPSKLPFIILIIVSVLFVFAVIKGKDKITGKKVMSVAFAFLLIGVIIFIAYIGVTLYFSTVMLL